MSSCGQRTIYIGGWTIFESIKSYKRAQIWSPFVWLKEACKTVLIWSKCLIKEVQTLGAGSIRLLHTVIFVYTGSGRCCATSQPSVSPPTDIDRWNVILSLLTFSESLLTNYPQLFFTASCVQACVSNTVSCQLFCVIVIIFLRWPLLTLARLECKQHLFSSSR